MYFFTVPPGGHRRLWLALIDRSTKFEIWDLRFLIQNLKSTIPNRLSRNSCYATIKFCNPSLHPPHLHIRSLSAKFAFVALDGENSPQTAAKFWTAFWWSATTRRTPDSHSGRSRPTWSFVWCCQQLRQGFPQQSSESFWVSFSGTKESNKASEQPESKDLSPSSPATRI